MTKKLEPRTDLVPDPFIPGRLVPAAMANIHPGQRFAHAVQEQQEGMSEGRLLANGETVEAGEAARAELVAGAVAAMSDRSGS